MTLNLLRRGPWGRGLCWWICEEKLLRLDKVGNVTLGIDAAGEEASTSAEAAAARDECENEGLAIDLSSDDFNNYEMD